MGLQVPGPRRGTPIIGAGNYCDERYGGAACTGFGELAMRVLTAKTAVDRLAAGMAPGDAARAAIADVNAIDRPRPAAMNVVVLARDGRYASATNRRYLSPTRRTPRRFAAMTSDMDDPLVADRIVVRG